MLPRIRLVQIGDLHLPTAALARRNVDHKDKAFSIELRNIISSVPVKVVFRQIYRLLTNGSYHAVLLMGDLTDVGSIEYYQKSVAFIANSLQLGAGRHNEDVLVGIVPGNHDINRELAKEPGLGTKFAQLNEALHRHKLPLMPVERSIETSIETNGAAASLILMNSCWGCGAIEYIPAEFRASIAGAIENDLNKGDESLLRTYYDRQFDTPAFSNQCISDLVHTTKEAHESRLLIVAAHHNLLPQRLARLAPYTELVNSGALRASLLEAGRPVLYLHGHIHEDPIEVVSFPGGDNLVCVSAPAAENGFNIVEVVFTRSGAPLACQVTPWRFDQSGILREQPLRSIPLIGQRRRSHSRALGHVYSHLINVGECYWSDLTAVSPPFFASDEEAQLQECVELLVADQTITVENYRSGPINWIIRANI